MFYRILKEEMFVIVFNSNIKIFGKFEDLIDIFDLVVKFVGEVYVLVVDGYEMVDDGVGSYCGNIGV